MIDRIDTTTQPLAFYMCELCEESGNESNCQAADLIRREPAGRWCCQHCYDDIGDEPGERPLWAELPKAVHLAAEVERLQTALAAMQRDTHGGVTLPDEMATAILAIGRVEWGGPDPRSDEKHVEDFANTLRLTREHFKTEGPQALHGVYIEGTGIVVCHTGTSPNSGIHAQTLTGAWNWLLAIAAAQGDRA